MKKTINVFIGVISLFIITITYANHTPAHYLAYFDQGSIYNITLQNNQLSWIGIAGKEKGEMQKDLQFKHATLGSLDVYQWVGKTGSFVTLALDKSHGKILCTGQTVNKRVWFWNGKIKAITNNGIVSARHV